LASTLGVVLLGVCGNDPTEEANIRLARERFAAESAHDTPRTLARTRGI
jgi:hypothetical protein